jgi:uncharacterized protein YecT (DUF1311 family)
MRRLRFALMGLAVAVLVLPAAARAQADPPADPPANPQAIGASFDCSKATHIVEKAICGDAGLSAQDHWLDLAYRDLRMLDPGRTEVVRTEEIRWLRQRNQKCGSADAREPEPMIYCLYRAYRDRGAVLYGQAFDAIAARVTRDPATAAQALLSLQSPRTRLYADILIHAASDQDKAFSDFINVMPERIDRDNHAEFSAGLEHLPLPCALVDRYPRLLLAARAYFLSSMDLMLPDIDCPGLSIPKGTSDFLADNPATQQNWLARCSGEGTMFHGYWRNRDLAALRLARFPRSYLSSQIRAIDAPDEPWPEAEALDSSWGDDPDYPPARDALAQFYRQRFDLSVADAQTAARRALWDNQYRAGNPAKCFGED